MSTEKSERGALKVPRLKGKALAFAQTVLAIRIPYPQAVRAFLDSFPEYLENDELDAEEVAAHLEERFQRMLHNTQRVSYHKIKETEASLNKLLDCIPIASPLVQLIELEKMRQDPSLINEKLLKVISLAGKVTERLLPRERVSPFRPPGTVGLPDLPIAGGSETSEAGDSDETQSDQQHSKNTSKRSPFDPFGGAMMKEGTDVNRHTGQETSQDS